MVDFWTPKLSRRDKKNQNSNQIQRDGMSVRGGTFLDWLEHSDDHLRGLPPNESTDASGLWASTLATLSRPFRATLPEPDQTLPTTPESEGHSPVQYHPHFPPTAVYTVAVLHCCLVALSRRLCTLSAALQEFGACRSPSFEFAASPSSESPATDWVVAQLTDLAEQQQQR